MEAGEIVVIVDCPIELTSDILVDFISRSDILSAAKTVPKFGPIMR
jgi:hypothetical protein